MLVSGTHTSPLVGEGLLQHIDLVGRAVTVLLERGPLIFDVPPTCEILLNGERVKLRMLQPRDRVQITYCRRRGLLTALSLEATTRL